MSLDDPPASPRPTQLARLRAGLRALPFAWWWPLAVGVAIGLATRLAFDGSGTQALTVMTRSFVLLVPIVVGAATVFVAHRVARRSPWYDVLAGAGANVLLVLGTLAILVEGLICVIVIGPLFAVLGGVSGLATGVLCRMVKPPRGTLPALAALPFLSAALEQGAPPATHVATIERVRVVAAPPERVWRELVDTRAIEPEEIGHAWLYRIGVPLPTSGVVEPSLDGPVRRVAMGEGIRFDQLAAVWEPNRHVRWAYRFAPDSFPPRALDDHVRIGGAFFDLGETDYVLTPLEGGRTELRVVFRHRVSTRFNWYAVPIADGLAGNFAEVVLGFYAARAERAALP